MRKNMLFAMLILASIMLSGCVSGESQPTTTVSPTTTAAPPTEPPSTAPPTVPPTTAPAELRQPGIHGDIPWQQYDDAFQKAREEGTYVFMYFWRDQCVFCASMDSSTFIDPAVVSYLEDHFGIVDVDIWSDAPISSIDPSLSGETLNARFRPPGVPAMAILDADGTIIIGISGYKSSESLLAILGYVTSGSYEDMTLEEYMDTMSTTNG